MSSREVWNLITDKTCPECGRIIGFGDGWYFDRTRVRAVHDGECWFGRELGGAA